MDDLRKQVILEKLAWWATAKTYKVGKPVVEQVLNVRSLKELRAVTAGAKKIGVRPGAGGIVARGKKPEDVLPANLMGLQKGEKQFVRGQAKKKDLAAAKQKYHEAIGAIKGVT